MRTREPRYRVVGSPPGEDGVEHTARHEVVDQSSGQTVLAFEGTVHENYDNLGHDSYRGVVYVALEPDGESLRVTEYEFTTEHEWVLVIPGSTADGLSPKERADVCLRSARDKELLRTPRRAPRAEDAQRAAARAPHQKRSPDLEATRARNLARPMTGFFRCPTCCSPEVRDEGVYEIGNLTCLECGATEIGDNEQLRGWSDWPR